MRLAALCAAPERIRQKEPGEVSDRPALVRRHRKQAAQHCKHHRFLRRLYPVEGRFLLMQPGPSRICNLPALKEPAQASNFPAKSTNQVEDLIAWQFRSGGQTDRKFSS